MYPHLKLRGNMHDGYVVQIYLGGLHIGDGGIYTTHARAMGAMRWEKRCLIKEEKRDANMRRLMFHVKHKRVAK